MLLDPLEEQLYLPAAAVQLGNCQCRQLEIVGQKDEQPVVFGVVEFYPPQLNRIVLTGLGASQQNRLVAAQARALVHGTRVDAPVLQIGFGANNEKGLRLMQRMEPVEIDIAPIHHIKAARLENHLIEDIHVVQLAIRDMDERRDIASQVEQGVQFDCGLLLAESRPREQCQAQIDGGGVQRIRRLLQLHPEPVLGIESAGDVDERIREILIDAPVAALVGAGQRAAGDPAANAQVVELARLRAQAGLDVAQAFAVGELREHYAQKLIEVRERERRVCPRVFRHAPSKRVQRQMLHQLREHQLARIHRTVLIRLSPRPTTGSMLSIYANLGYSAEREHLNGVLCWWLVFTSCVHVGSSFLSFRMVSLVNWMT